MAGYTPVFDSVYAGSLCGKWPTTAVWVTLLPLCDKHGRIDLSYQAICALTGWPIDLLKQGISDLMQPDPDSRSAAEEGRRLVPLDPGRSWGWQVVNHGLYREKARKLQYDNERTASGRDAARKKASREVPTSPAKSREVPLSDADADADKNSEVLPSPSLHPHVSGSSPTLKPQERLKKSSGEQNGREKLKALTRALAQAKALPKSGRARSPPAPNAERTEPQRPEGAEGRQR